MCTACGAQWLARGSRVFVSLSVCDRMYIHVYDVYIYMLEIHHPCTVCGDQWLVRSFLCVCVSGRVYTYVNIHI